MFIVSMILTLAGAAALILWGLNLGVDFRGGSVLELNFLKERPALSEVTKALASGPGKDALLTPVGDNGLILKTGELSESDHQKLLSQLKVAFPKSGIEERKFDSVGPLIGSELKHKSIIAISIVLVSIVIYIALVFRRVGGALSPWVMGVAAIIAVLHDVIIPLGVFAWLGKYRGIELNAVFVAAVLTILGYSISDTVVVFDRVRENVIRGGLSGDFAQTVHRSIMQTLVRSLNTTFTTLLSLIAVYLFGGESVKYFALALIIGITSGAYSSIFVASPLLVWWSRKRK